ncbi:MAG TPA: DEAD/DEAH box helicase [Clostridia bacterium]
MDTFEIFNINAALVAALKKENIITPTEIQLKVIPEAKKNLDIIAQSETGTGKTLAFVIPLFEKLDPSLREMQAMVLVPTHELAVQVQRQIELLSKNSEIKLTSAVIIGNVNIERQIEKLKEKPNIIVGSPGRILELIKKRKISAHTIKTIVIDESDRLLDENNIETVQAVIKSTLKERQLMMFSATMREETRALGKKIMKDPLIIEAEGGTIVPQAIEHCYFLSEPRDKIEVLRKLAKAMNPPKALVFTKGGQEIELIVEKLKYHGIRAESIQGANIKLDRKKALEDLRSGKVQLLITTDVAARGLDIEGLTHVFNLNLPENHNDYIHRVGRTGRKGNAGTAVSIVSQGELKIIKTIEKALKIKISGKSVYEGKITDGVKYSIKKPAAGVDKARDIKRPKNKFGGKK